MAVTVLNSPTTPNVTGTKLVYTISGSSTNQPQFQYVTDIYESGSSNLLTRLYTYPNLQGSGIVDVAKILDDNLEYDNYWKVTGSIAPDQSVKTFDIRFGEAYGTSISSSVTIYTGSTPNYLEVFPGIVDANQGSFDFQSASFFDGASNTFLTNNPSANDPAFPPPVRVASYNYSNILNSTDYHSLTMLYDSGSLNGLRLSFTKIVTGSIPPGVVDYITISQASTDSYFNTYGVGPMNVRSQVGVLTGKTIGELLDSGSINAYSTTPDTPGGTTFVIKDKWDGIRKTDPAGYWSMWNMTWDCETEDYTRFSWINKYGFWDYYNVYNPTRRVTDVDRKTYDQNYVDYSSVSSIYSSTKRGETQYNTAYTDRYEITTDYVDKKMADWLTELFDSPDVYIQSDNGFIPIEITSTSYTWNMDENRQKLFQFTIQYKYANNRPDR